MKKFFKISVKWALIGLYALVFGEFFLRAFDPQPMMPRYVTGAPDGIRANIPNSVYRQWTPEVDVEVRINSEGMRADREIPVEKAPDTYRIVILGDSFMMGYEVDLKDSFAWLLEEGLKAEGLKVEVINLAVSGFGTAEELIALKERGLKYKPDLVLMEWHTTDVDDNVRSGLFKMVDGTLQPASSTYLPGVELTDKLMKIPLYEWAISNSHFYSAIRERAAAIIKDILATARGGTAVADDANDAPPAGADTVAGEITDAGVALSHLLVDALAKEAEGAGAAFMVLDVPVRLNRLDYRASGNDLGDGAFARYPYVNPVEAFKAAAAPDKKLYFEEGHRHWTPEGNRIVADLAVRQATEILRGRVPVN
ncbi:SGNH/GDSL hydrolase family protein [Pseudokordiimonas caeni]|uniref:SGNH/GDSL hydrolase family protein n=1 Tax=Pseudokordiimonas caeni TaxID=2997908 RepID=UPI002810D170|nr:hypothetical protein [Pseudokordiimonas caeni]